MPHIPTICDRCGEPAWSDILIKDDTYHLSGMVTGTCHCGGNMRILDGTYTHLGGPLGFCRASKEDRERFYKAMEALGGEAWVRPEDREEACPMPSRIIKGAAAEQGKGNGALKAALGSLQSACLSQGPLDQRSAALLQLGAVMAKGGDNDLSYQVKAALKAGLSPEEIEHAVLCVLPAIGEAGAAGALAGVKRMLEDAS